MPIAGFWLGFMHKDGMYVKQDEEKAKALYKKTDDAGVKPAQKRLLKPVWN